MGQQANIKLVTKKVGCEVVKLVKLSQGRVQQRALLKTVMNF
jgi:hypothetical protein